MKKKESPDGVAPRRRPHKFGRPSRLVALTLPDDVVNWFLTLDPDPGRAIVGLFNRLAEHPVHQPAAARQGAPEIAEIGGCRGLIVVNPDDVSDLPRVATIPFFGGRAFLALEPDQSIADLELAVVDAIDAAEHDDVARRESLTRLRAALREWRTDPSLRFRERTIIVVERVRVRRRKGHGKAPTHA